MLEITIMMRLKSIWKVVKVQRRVVMTIKEANLVHQPH